MNSRIRNFTEALGLRLMYAVVINFYIILVVAAIGDHTVEVIFNHYNEAYIEYIIYIIIFPIMTFAILSDIRKRRERKKRRKNEMKGIQKAVYEYIKKSSEMGLDYVPSYTIIEEMKKLDPSEDWVAKVSQALYHLQKKTKFKHPLIKKVHVDKGTFLGYTTIEDKRKL